MASADTPTPSAASAPAPGHADVPPTPSQDTAPGTEPADATHAASSDADAPADRAHAASSDTDAPANPAHAASSDAAEAADPALIANADPTQLQGLRTSLEKRIHALKKETHRLEAERKAIDHELHVHSREQLEDRLMGPVVPQTAGQSDLPAGAQAADAPTAPQADSQAPATPAAAATSPAQPDATAPASAQPATDPGHGKHHHHHKHRMRLFSTGTPSAAQKAAAGQGVQRRDGRMLTPRFVSLFGHVVSTTTAIYALLCVVAGAFLIPLFIGLANTAILDIAHGGVTGNLEVTIIVFAIQCLLMMALAVCFLAMAVRMVLGREHWRLRICETAIIVLSGVILCHLVVFGMTSTLIVYGLDAALLIALHSYWDPELALERANRRTQTESLRQMIHDGDERTIVPGKRSGRGYITLNFFNLFWIFTICSVLGLVIETIFHFIVFHAYQDRAGMLWGPLSPIYGFGGLLMTIALNRFHNKPVWLIFLVSALIGGAFEFFTSWFMQTAFGVTAWNYSGTFLSIDGRTNGFFMCCWGLLGLVWVKLLLPVMLYFVKKIPWGWRYTLTTICAIFMIFDGAATLTTIDCWYMREAGVPVTTPIEQFCAVHYDDAYMQNRFQTMTMNVHSTARTQTLSS